MTIVVAVRDGNAKPRVLRKMYHLFDVHDAILQPSEKSQPRSVAHRKPACRVAWPFDEGLAFGPVESLCGRRRS